MASPPATPPWGTAAFPGFPCSPDDSGHALDGGHTRGERRGHRCLGLGQGDADIGCPQRPAVVGTIPAHPHAVTVGKGPHIPQRTWEKDPRFLRERGKEPLLFLREYSKGMPQSSGSRKGIPHSSGNEKGTPHSSRSGLSPEKLWVPCSRLEPPVEVSLPMALVPSTDLGGDSQCNPSHNSRDTSLGSIP